MIISYQYEFSASLSVIDFYYRVGYLHDISGG